MTEKQAVAFLSRDVEPEEAELAVRVFKSRRQLGDTVFDASIQACRAVIKELEKREDESADTEGL